MNSQIEWMGQFGQIEVENPTFVGELSVIEADLKIAVCDVEVSREWHLDIANSFQDIEFRFVSRFVKEVVEFEPPLLFARFESSWSIANSMAGDASEYWPANPKCVPPGQLQRKRTFPVVASWPDSKLRFPPNMVEAHEKFDAQSIEQLRHGKNDPH